MTGGFRKAYDALNEASDRLPLALQSKLEAALLILAEADAREHNESPKIDVYSWNAALEAATKLLEGGFLFFECRLEAFLQRRLFAELLLKLEDLGIDLLKLDELFDLFDEYGDHAPSE